MHPNLSFEQAPPISVPYRFFLTAPWFGVAAGILIAWFGESAVATRWSGEALAVTHLLVVGFMLQAMSGALLQFVPVAAGGNVWRPRLLAGMVHPALIVATVLLVLAFLFSGSHLFRVAAALFLVAVGLFVAAVWIALWRTPAQGATIRALRLSVPSLLVTVLLGATLADGLASGRSLPLMELTNVHAAWGLGGWALLLLAGVSYYVVPMFQLTPGYPVVFSRWLPPLVVLVLLAWSLQIGGDSPDWQRLVWLAGLLLGAAFAVVTLWLQHRRRRRISDPTMVFFRGAMICMLAILASGLSMTAIPDLHQSPRAAYWLGVLIIPGVFLSVINGMLYKIVPFLNWLHLQKSMGLGTLPPNMKDMIPESAVRRQMLLHFAAVGFLLAAAIEPELARPAGMLLALSCALLGYNLISAVRFFRDFKDRVGSA
jgi:predicted outer membrane lipoprotein